MGEKFRLYIISLNDAMPLRVYEILLLVLCIVIVFLLVCKCRKIRQYLSLIVLLEYISLIICSTVIFRCVTNVKKINITPFWSYKEPDLIPENIMNVLVFIPIGLLIGFAIKRIKWWYVLIIGVVISVSVELLQFELRRGLAEVDDVMHNTLGCMMGYGMYLITSMLARKVKCL